MKILRFLRLLFLASGIVMLVLCAVFSWKTESFRRTAQRVSGTVIEDQTKTDSDGDTKYYPRFSFLTKDGQTISIQSNTGSNPAAFHTGDAISVLYDSTDPQGAKIDGFLDLWFVPSVFGFIAIAHLLISHCFLFLIKRIEKRAQSPTH